MTRKKTKKEKESSDSPFETNPTYTTYHRFVDQLKHLAPDERPKFYYNKKGWLICQLITFGGED
jgi:hypothetical protein